LLDTGYWILDARWFKKLKRFNKFKRLIERFEQNYFPLRGIEGATFGGLRGLF
jgi:hypothetical protein